MPRRRSGRNARTNTPAPLRDSASPAAAGLIPAPAPGKSYASAREHGMHALRHFYASVLLDAGESNKAVSEYLGHSGPAMTLRVYAHLMPSSAERARRALDTVMSER